MLKPLRDGKTVFIETLNFDPRFNICSILEMSRDDETLAQLIDKRFIQSQYDAAGG